MTTQLITPPTELAISLDAAKASLRIDGDDQDALIEAWIFGVSAHAEHVTQRSFIAQTWRATLPAFPYNPRSERPYELCLPSSPLIEITKFAYIDAEGVERVLAPADYQVSGDFLLPPVGAAWPATRGDAAAVVIEGVFGYGETADAVPHGIRMYLLARLGQSFDPATRPEKDTVQSAYIDRMLDPYRRYV